MLDDDADLARLRDALAAAGYRYDAVAALLGPVASAALGRAELVPALRATTGGTPVETLVRLFLLGTTEPETAVAAALPLDAALRSGLVERDRDGVRAALDVRPYAADDGDWWVVSDLGTDLRPPPLRPDHVLGVGGASTTLAQATVRSPVANALDVGTGCGVQALHLSRHAGAVTATDRNPRALALARATAFLNGLSWELLAGDLLAPVAGRAFGLVVANPPFVVGPARDDYAYRDSGVAGDAVSSRLVREAPALLAEGGVAQLLANWVHLPGADWRERVASWVPDGCDALVLQRETQDPAEYVGLWLRDAGETGARYARRYDEWLAWFERERVTAVGFGIVTLRRTAGAAAVRVEDAPQPVVQPLGPHLASWLGRVAALRGADLLDARLRVAADVTLEQVATHSPDGWAVAVQALQQHGGLRWRAETDPVGVALAAACDGTRPLRDLLPVLAAAFDLDPDDLGRGALAAVRHLVERGFLLP
ncbi:MAG TPA: methyltransferase [Mycobacteriales bacterium]|nr:methyltransferase [Mycobacteriales bacterium]